ncbi:alanine racemase [Vampirovibrio chlorellavorus]|uniref:alanine racemase n=1 Tax=Vampirovibrio chlorellavorus TaxID=758823 RepID=UPI0026E932BD|nr:alanine racemase [Vampirovibrio chlorellavorus]
MKSLRTLPVQTRRDAWVEINLGAIEANARAIRKVVPPSVALMAVVKADAYGHGSAMVLNTLGASGVSMAGVASMDEAIHIRESGIKLPILVIGVVPDWSVQYASDYDIQLTIFAPHHVESLRKAYQQDKKPFKVHIKVDTGMHRIGIGWEKALNFIRECQTLPFLQVEGVFTHLADSHDEALTQPQLARWHTLCQQLDPLPRFVHIANSGHALNPAAWEAQTPNTLARLGIAFFGYGNHPQQEGIKLQPAMSLKARIIHVQTVGPNTGVSYSHTYHTPAAGETRIATVPLGYADGVPRILSGRIHGLIGGKQVPQVGRITMDQMMFDVSAIPDAQVGDIITLIGRSDARQPQTAIWLDDWASKASTIEYELMCALRVRLPKTYTR